jgi:hypothetical protein
VGLKIKTYLVELLALALLASCSPAVKVARHYRNYTKNFHEQQRKPLHTLPLD